MTTNGMQNDLNRNSSGSFTVCLNDIGKDLEKLRKSKLELQKRADRLRQEREDLVQRLDAMQRRKQALDGEYEELEGKQKQIEETIGKAEETYLKLLESSQTLSAFVKKETEAVSGLCSGGGNEKSLNGGY